MAFFSPPVFITVGDEYDKRTPAGADRFKGVNMKTQPSKRGQQGLFQKQFLSLSQGDKYIDPGLYDRRYRLEQDKKKITPEGFRYSSGPKKPAGSGTYFGTFSERDPPKHEVEYAVVKKGEKPDAARPHLKNFVTNPGKKGTFGYAGLTLGKGDETKYVSDPYEGERRRAALAGKESAKKIVGPAFRGACKRGGFFDETTHGVSRVYTIDRPLPAKRPDTDKPTPMSKAWRPAGVLVAEITKFPEYQEDPFEAKEKAMREARKSERPTKAWKPIGGPKTAYTRPIKYAPAE